MKTRKTLPPMAIKGHKGLEQKISDYLSTVRRSEDLRGLHGARIAWDLEYFHQRLEEENILISYPNANQEPPKALDG